MGRYVVIEGGTRGGGPAAQPGSAGRPLDSAQVFWLAGPVLVEQLLLYLVGLSDTILTGRYLSDVHLAAVTNATYLLWFLGSLLTIVSVGATALVARHIGAAERDAAERITQQALSMALVLGSLILLVGWLVAPGFVRLLNLSGPAADAAALFLRTVLLITPLLACTTAGIACLRAQGTRAPGCG